MITPTATMMQAEIMSLLLSSERRSALRVISAILQKNVLQAKTSPTTENTHMEPAGIAVPNTCSQVKASEVAIT